MIKIYKYELPVDGDVVIIKNKVIKFLEVQSQNDIPTIWAMIDENEKEDTSIIAVGTGWEVPSGCKEYLGTVQDEYGFVWHYFVYEAKTLEEDKENYVMDVNGFAVLAQELGRFGISANELEQEIQKIMLTSKELVNI